MLIKFFKIFCLILLLISQSPVYSKNKDIKEFNSKNLSSYFSALVSYDNQKNIDALKFFKLSNSLISRHDPYLKAYVFSLVMEGKIKQSIKQLKQSSGEKSSDFFEAYLILMLDSIKKKDFKRSNRYLNELSKFKRNGTFELIIYESLKNYIYLFENKQTLSNNNTLGNLSLISKIFHSCYLGEKQTQTYFENLVNSDEIDYSRYIFFYINYLIEQNQFNKAKEITDQIDILNNSLLIAQTKNWIDKKEFEKFNQIFSCKNEIDILGEFFFLIANIYSSENELEKSNFYLNISNFLNPKFRFNLSLLAENYYNSENYRKSDKVLNNFNKNDDVYYWYKTKKKTRIFSKESGEQEAYNFINSKFKQIENRIQFLFCYYFSVLLDQAVHSSMREEHSSFDNLARYPKFCGILGSFHTNLNPSLLLSLATLYTSDQDFDKATNDVKKLSNFFPDDYYQFFTHEYSKLTGRLERQDLQSNAMYTLFSELSNAVALLFQPNSLRPFTDGIPNKILFEKWISLISKNINEKLEQIKK